MFSQLSHFLLIGLSYLSFSQVLPPSVLYSECGSSSLTLTLFSMNRPGVYVHTVCVPVNMCGCVHVCM